jgi:hypothetical protein
MPRQANGVIVALLLLLVSLCSQAQDGADRSLKANPDASSTISNDVLASNGFSFADQRRPMCKINGLGGRCGVEAFVSGETRVDEASFTCNKLDRATYIGRCINGKLDGLSIVIADGSKKRVKEAFISYFNQGRMAYPALTSVLAGDANFGVQEQGRSYGCVYFGKWDKASERCDLFTKIYGTDLFTESNAQELRDGSFDLDKYSARFLEYTERKH